MRYNKFALLLIWISIFLAFPAMSYGHGWAGYEQGAKAHGMGGAFTGLADDPTAVYYNPAGISWLDGTQGSLGFAVPTGRGHYTSDGISGIPGSGAGDSSNLKKQYFFIPNLYLTSKVNEKISLGFGEYTIFGLGFKWPNSFEGRYAPGGKNGELETMTLSPVVAYQITDKVSVAFGGRVERADITLENFLFVAPGVDDVRSKISGDDYGYAWNAGLMFKISDELSAGLSYRSKIKHSFENLDVEFSPEIDTLGPVPVGILNTKADLDVTLPQFLSFGVAWSKGAFSLTLDGYWWEWSELDELKFQLDDPVAGQPTLVTPMKWNDTWTWAIGGEYVVNAFDRDISLRGGFMYEECPVPDDTVIPAGYNGDNLLYNIGFGSMIGPFYTDVYFTYVYTRDRRWDNAFGSVPNPGGGQVAGSFKDYETYIIGSNLTYKF